MAGGGDEGGGGGEAGGDEDGRGEGGGGEGPGTTGSGGEGGGGHAVVARVVGASSHAWTRTSQNILIPVWLAHRAVERP